MRKQKFTNYSFEQMSKFVSMSSSFEEVLMQMGYKKSNDKLIISNVRKYCDKLCIEHKHLPNTLSSDMIMCNICGKTKTTDHYYFSNGKLGQKVCKECVREKQNKKYHSTKDFLNDYKQNHPCVKCGCSKFYLIDFHHIDPAQKDYNISENHNAKIETIIQEIEKCVTLCSNCHREFHYLEKENKITIQEYLNDNLYVPVSLIGKIVAC